MRRALPFALLLLAACHKPDVEVFYGSTCDKCRIEYVGEGGQTKSIVLDTHRYDSDGVKVLDGFTTTVMLEHDVRPRITLYRDSGYAHMMVRAELETKSRRVYGAVETLEH